MLYIIVQFITWAGWFGHLRSVCVWHPCSQDSRCTYLFLFISFTISVPKRLSVICLSTVTITITITKIPLCVYSSSSWHFIHHLVNMQMLLSLIQWQTAMFNYTTVLIALVDILSNIFHQHYSLLIENERVMLMAPVYTAVWNN